jgi:hypothetical protein
MAKYPASDAGLLTIGMRVGIDRAEVVIPMVDVNGDHGGPDELCRDLVNVFVAQALPNFLGLIGNNAEVLYVEAVGMIPGAIPYREVFAPGDNPGTREGEILPPSVGGIVTFYPSSSDLSLGNRVVVGKNVIPGITEGDVEQGYLVQELIDLIDTWAGLLIGGLTGSDSLWKRTTNIRRVVGEEVRVAILNRVRSYVGHIRKRLTPH